MKFRKRHLAIFKHCDSSFAMIFVEFRVFYARCDELFICIFCSPYILSETATHSDFNWSSFCRTWNSKICKCISTYQKICYLDMVSKKASWLLSNISLFVRSVAKVKKFFGNKMNENVKCSKAVLQPSITAKNLLKFVWWCIFFRSRTWG